MGAFFSHPMTPDTLGMPTAELGRETAGPEPDDDGSMIALITALTLKGEEPHQNTTPEIAPRGDGEGGEGPLLCFHGIFL